MKLSSMIGVTCFGLLFLPLLFVQAQEPTKVTIAELMNQSRKDLHAGRDVETRLRGIEGFVSLGAEISNAITSLEIALGDSDDQVRAKAAIAIAGIGPSARRTRHKLVKALETDKISQVRIAAARALGCIFFESRLTADEKKAVLALGRALREDTDTLVRYSCCLALRNIGSDSHDAAPDLLEAMKSKNAQVAELARDVAVRGRGAGLQENRSHVD